MPRITFTLPDDEYPDLLLISSSLKCSVSALVRLMVSERLDNLDFEQLRAVSSDHVILKRARGESLDTLAEQYRELLDGFEQ